MALNDSIVPARFMFTMGHLMAVLMIFFSKEDNVRAGLPLNPPAGDVDDKDTELRWGGGGCGWRGAGRC